MGVLDATPVTKILLQYLEIIKFNLNNQDGIAAILFMIQKFINYNVDNVRDIVKEKYFHLNFKQQRKAFVLSQLQFLKIYLHRNEKQMIDLNIQRFIGIRNNYVRPAKWEDVLTCLNNKIIYQREQDNMISQTEVIKLCL